MLRARRQLCRRRALPRPDGWLLRAWRLRRGRQLEADPALTRLSLRSQPPTTTSVDSASKVIHSVAVTPANPADRKVMDQLLHGQEARIWADHAYKSQGLRARADSCRSGVDQALARAAVGSCSSWG